VVRETERIVPAEEGATCHLCGATVTEWRERVIERPRELVTLLYCTVCGEFVSGGRGFPPGYTPP